MFFLKGWCPRCDIFKLTGFLEVGEVLCHGSGTKPGTTAEGQNCGFFLFLKVKRSCSKAARQLGKKVVGRWSLVVGCFFFLVVVCFFWWLVGRGKKERQNNKQKAHSDCSRLCLFECVKYCITNHK